MAKDNPKEPTPFEKFDALAKRIIRVPKRKIKKVAKRPHAT
jgi:hypothetical protein